MIRNLIEHIGNTPIVEISGIEGQKARLAVKLESFNPGGSSKDRAALAMIEDAEKKGLLKKGATIIEPTSGNTGVGLAWISAVKGYRTIIIMPDTMSVERRNLLKAYGAELILLKEDEGFDSAIRKAEELHESIPGSFIPNQFTNPANPQSHENTTATEIWRDTDGAVDILVACVGTGETVSGTGRGLKRMNPGIEVVAVEPAGSPFLSTGKAGKHRIEGIGASFKPEIFDSSVVDRIMTVEDDEAFEDMRLLARRYGILAGISSAAAFHAAVQLSLLEENEGKLIVAILPDTGERYLSEGIF